MTPVDIVFEKWGEEVWEPVQFKDLRAGDVTRMREFGGDVLRDENNGEEQFRVSAMSGSDPDSHHRYDISLDPIEVTK